MKVVSFALLASGIVLAVLGVQAMNSAGSRLSRIFSGTPTTGSMEMLAFGVVAAILGMGGLLSHRR